MFIAELVPPNASRFISCLGRLARDHSSLGRDKIERKIGRIVLQEGSFSFPDSDDVFLVESAGLFFALFGTALRFSRGRSG